MTLDSANRPCNRGAVRRWRSLVVLVLGAVVALLSSVPAAAAPQPLVPGLPVYLALGDSWAFGVGATNPATDGYVPQLLQILRSDLDCSPAQSEPAKDGCEHLQLLNLARGGATAPLVIKEQFKPVALPLLQSRNGDRNPRNDVELITLHVGGNDVVGPISDACLRGLTPSCLSAMNSEFMAFESDFRTLLRKLRDAAGDQTPIVVGTYANPVPFCALGQVDGAAQLGAIVVERLNDIIRQVGAEFGATSAEVFDVLNQPGDFVGGDDCLHPSDAGYDKITNVFADVILP